MPAGCECHSNLPLTFYFSAPDPHLEGFWAAFSSDLVPMVARLPGLWREGWERMLEFGLKLLS